MIDISTGAIISTAVGIVITALVAGIISLMRTKSELSTKHDKDAISAWKEIFDKQELSNTDLRTQVEVLNKQIFTLHESNLEYIDKYKDAAVTIIRLQAEVTALKVKYVPTEQSIDVHSTDPVHVKA